MVFCNFAARVCVCVTRVCCFAASQTYQSELAPLVVSVADKAVEVVESLGKTAAKQKIAACALSLLNALVGVAAMTPKATLVCAKLHTLAESSSAGATKAEKALLTNTRDYIARRGHLAALHEALGAGK